MIIHLLLLALLYAVDSPLAPWFALAYAIGAFLAVVLILDKHAPKRWP